jgi:hypothetical protein
MNSLLELQRRMAEAVMQPLTAAEGMRRRTGTGRSMTKNASEFIKPNSRLTSFERLEIYNRQYWFRVLDSFAEDFPGLRGVIGQKQFERLAQRYLTDCPSQSFTLRNLGSRLIGWLEAHPEFIGPRKDLALDMARLEWAHIEAFDSAERRPLTPAQIAGLNGDSKLSLQPHIHLLMPHYPLDDILLAVKSSSRDIAALGGRLRTKWLSRFGGPEKIFLAVHRAEFSVHYRRLEAGEFAVLTELQRGNPIGDAIESAFADQAGEAEDCARKVQQWFEIWGKLGWLCLPSARRKHSSECDSGPIRQAG